MRDFENKKLRDETSLTQEQALKAAADEFVNDGCMSMQLTEQLFSHAFAIEICHRFFRQEKQR